MKPGAFHCYCQGRRGMVLLELIIALSIFAVVGFSLVVALDTAMNAGRDRNEISAAFSGLENQMALLHAAPVVPVDKDLADDHSGITYHLSIESGQLKDQKGQPLPNIYRATITAKWISDGQVEDRTVSELLYQP